MIKELMKKAGEEANKAAQLKLDELLKSGPQFAVYNADVLSGKAEGKCIGTMLDVCGFSNIWISGTSKLVRELKKIGKKEGQYSQSFAGSSWYLFKSAYKGYILNFRVNPSRQELSINTAAMYAAAEVLINAGFDCRVESRID